MGLWEHFKPNNRMGAREEIKKLHAQAKEKAAKRAARQRFRNQSAPWVASDEDLTVAERLAVENCEWSEYAGMWVPKFTYYSDYSGGFVERSNAQYWRENYDFFSQTSGSYATVWTGICPDDLLGISEDDLERLKDDLEGLEDYPCLDDELMSTMEMEAKDEYWESDGRDDLRKELIADAGHDVMATLGAIYAPNAQIDEWFREYDLYDYLEVEEGGSVYFRTGQASAHVGNEVLSFWAEENGLDKVEQRAFVKHLDTFMKAAQKVADPRLMAMLGSMSDDRLFGVFRAVAEKDGESFWNMDEAKVDDPVDLFSVDGFNLNRMLTRYLDAELVRASEPTDPRQLQFKWKADEIQREARVLARALLYG